MTELVSLNEREDKWEETLELIESAFNYDERNSFAIDFAPLFHNNLSHCYIIIERDQVVAHTGYRKVRLSCNGKTFPVCFIGGVAVGQNHRGKGYSRKLLEKILEESGPETALYLLWSDKSTFYQKFDFFECGGIQQLRKGPLKEEGLKKTTLHDIKPGQFTQIQKLYKNSYLKNCLSVDRGQKDWEAIKKISSSTLYICERNEEVLYYFLCGKGQDLDGIIHEFGWKEGHRRELEKALEGGTWWLPEGLFEVEGQDLLYTALVKIGNKLHFREFISHWSGQRIKIVGINDQTVTFQFQDKEYKVPDSQFLTMIFGPGQVEEFKDWGKPLAISGLDSI